MANDDINDGIEVMDSNETPDGTESSVKDGGKGGVKFLDPVYNGLLPISLLAALMGAVLGPVPVVLFAYLTDIVFYPLFVVAPLLAYLFNLLLKGGRDIRAMIAATVFSLACAYITALACRAALYASLHSMSILDIPLITGLAIGEPGVIPSSASAYAYPLVFTALGLAVMWELLTLSKRNMTK
jgi:hypothetical protein